jgi:hypothetical protein
MQVVYFNCSAVHVQCQVCVMVVMHILPVQDHVLQVIGTLGHNHPSACCHRLP